MGDGIITALIGVGGTLAGTMLGWVLNNFSNKGKLNIFVSSWKDSFTYKNSIGEMVPCSKREEVQSYSYKVNFDIYNSSGNTKIMRSIQIAFADKKTDIEKHVPMDDATKQYFHPIVFYNKVESINIPPKAVIKLDLHNGAWNIDGKFDFIWRSKKVFLVYKDEKNKTKRILIKSENYENYFTNHKVEDFYDDQPKNAHPQQSE